MKTGYLTRAAHFSASHRYYRSDWTEERNRQRFGLMADPYGHGHNYRCEVTVCGPIDEGTGMVADLGELDRILEEEIVDRFHLRHINRAVPEFGPGGLLPTTENLAAFLLERIAGRLPSGVRVHRVRVMEDRDLWSDVYGES